MNCACCIRFTASDQPLDIFSYFLVIACSLKHDGLQAIKSLKAYFHTTPVPSSLCC